MKRKLILISMMAALAYGCAEANFGSKNPQRGGQDVQAGGLSNPDENPLNVSELEANKGRFPDGPIKGEGERTSKTVGLDCDTAGGVEVIVRSNPSTPPPTTSNPGPTDPTDPTNPGGPNGEEPFPDVTEDDVTGGGNTGGQTSGDNDVNDNGNGTGGDDDTDGSTGGQTGGGDDDDDNNGGTIGDESPFLLQGWENIAEILGIDGKPTKDAIDGKGGFKPGADKPLPDAPPIDVPVKSEVIGKVKGEFCPTATNRLTMLFVVDFSGSMGRHVPEGGQQEVPGNDPQIAGNCGRLHAARAILDRVLAERQPGDEIQVGLIPFAGGIVQNRVVKFNLLDDFVDLVNKDSFCSYVVQGPSFGYDPINPGGIDGNSGLFGFGRVDSSTNYTAAFQAAETALAPVYGRKVVYFVSDGEPTSGGIDPVAAGVDAGARLRANVDNLSLNALLLGDPGPHAWDVLVGVAGSPDRVRRAEDADELAREILEFPDATIDPATGEAFLTVAPYASEPLGLRYLRPAGRPGVWEYETQPFVLLGVPGQETVNQVDIAAEGSDGSTHSATVKFRYTFE